MAWRKHVGHIVILGVCLPLALGLPAVIFGAIIAAIEGWSFVDGLLYIGGDLVLVPLTPLVPSSTGGRMIDFFLSCLALGVFAWILALLGALPICTDTKSFIEVSLQRLCCCREGSFGSAVGMLLIFIHTALPLVAFLCAFPFGAVLAATEGWTYMASVDVVLGTVAHCPAFIPASAAPKTTSGKLFVLLISFYALAVSVGWAVGVMLAMPALDKAEVKLAQAIRKDMHLSPTLLGRGIAFFLIALIGIPLVTAPLVFSSGVILKYVEGWSSLMDAVLHVAGNLVLINLGAVRIPSTTGGKVVDFLVSVSGLGVFAFLIVVLGGLPFTDHCADKLGGKREGFWPALQFVLLFFLFVLPVVCLIMALPLAGMLTLAEPWSFGDSWLFVLGVMVQSPGLPPPLVLSTDAGKLVCFIVMVWGICISVGWGVGVIVATAGLDEAAKFVVACMSDPSDLQTSSETEEGKELPAAASDNNVAQVENGSNTGSAPLTESNAITKSVGFEQDHGDNGMVQNQTVSADSAPTESVLDSAPTEFFLEIPADNANSSKTGAAASPFTQPIQGELPNTSLNAVDLNNELDKAEDAAGSKKLCNATCCSL